MATADHSAPQLVPRGSPPRSYRQEKEHTARNYYGPWRNWRRSRWRGGSFFPLGPIDRRAHKQPRALCALRPAEDLTGSLSRLQLASSQVYLLDRARDGVLSIGR